MRSTKWNFLEQKKVNLWNFLALKTYWKRHRIGLIPLKFSADHENCIKIMIGDGRES
jgi:hypothetical protein